MAYESYYGTVGPMGPTTNEAFFPTTTTTENDFVPIFKMSTRHSPVKRMAFYCFDNDLDIEIWGIIDKLEEFPAFKLGGFTIYAGDSHNMSLDWVVSAIEIRIKPHVPDMHGTLVGGLHAVSYLSQITTSLIYESITVTSAVAIGITRADIFRVSKAMVTVEDNPIRFRLDGNADPTVSEGHLLQPGDGLSIDSGIDLLNFRCIATGANAKLRVTYSM